MIPIPGGSQDTEGQLVHDLLAEFLRDFSLQRGVDALHVHKRTS